MIWLYRFLFPVAFLVGLPFYARRILRRGGYRERFGDRFGSFEKPSRRPGPTVWFQAVSVGEVLAIAPVLGRVRAQLPEANLYVTTTTSTGFGLLQDRPNAADWTGYFPLDFWPVSRRTWKKLQPDLCVLMEGELWPEHLYQARAHGVPVLLVNARLSDRSFKRYRKLGKIGRWPFGMLSRVLASSPQDADRFRQITPGIRIDSMGNLKFDVEFPPRPKGYARQTEFRDLGLIKEDSSSLPLLLLGSSTWPGEEKLLLQTLKELLNRQIDARLLLVPRHAERRRDVVAAVEENGLAYTLRSVDGPCKPDHPVYIADTTGELRYFSSLADVAFIGKSLPPNEGGQTPIEAAAYGVPMVYGPAMSNFKAACRSLEECGASLPGGDAEEIHDTLINLATHAEVRDRIGAKAVAWHHANRGAVERVAGAILNCFPRETSDRKKP